MELTPKIPESPESPERPRSPFALLSRIATGVVELSRNAIQFLLPAGESWQIPSIAEALEVLDRLAPLIGNLVSVRRSEGDMTTLRPLQDLCGELLTESLRYKELLSRLREREETYQGLLPHVRGNRVQLIGLFEEIQLQQEKVDICAAAINRMAEELKARVEQLSLTHTPQSPSTSHQLPNQT